MAADEQLDIYTWQGAWTGVSKPKKKVHTDGDIHACAHGIVTDGAGRILMQRRGEEVALLRGFWDIVSGGGHITALTAAQRADPHNWDLIGQAWRTLVREFDEELGYELDPEMLLGDDCHMFGITRTDQPTEDGWMDRTLSLNFMLRLPGIDPSQLRLEAGKVEEVAWVPADAPALWLETGAGGPLATRKPDDYHLLRGATDGARRMQVSRLLRETRLFS